MRDRIFWEAVLATAITAFFFTDSIRQAILTTIAYVFIFFVVIIITEQFFKKGWAYA